MNLPFTENKKPLTLGIELEFQVLDKHTHELTPHATRIIDAIGNKKITRELFQSTVEVVSDVHNSVTQASADLANCIKQLEITGNALEFCFASTGTHPQADYRDRLVSAGKRYSELIDRNQWLIRRMAVYGMHMHLGMKNGDDCIRFNNFFLRFVPHLIALSASSPYWQKMDTGLVSCRPTMYEALPTAGMPYMVKNWSAFEGLIQFLKRSDAIQSLKDLWWDLRPSPAFGTLEIRICDAPATQSEMTAVAAFIHLLAFWFQDNQHEWSKNHAPIKRWIFRENKWRAIRYGLDASIIVTQSGKTRSLKDDINFWIQQLHSYAGQHQYHEAIHTLHRIIDRGNSATRQRKIFELSGSLGEVVNHNIREFQSGQPIWH